LKLLVGIFSWLLCIIFGFAALSIAANGHWIRTLILLILVLLLLPPLRKLPDKLTGKSFSRLGRFVSVVCLLAVFFLVGYIIQPTSIYISPEYEAQFMVLYDAHMKEWPVPYETRFVDTKYGKVHVIIGGPKDAPPALLCHAGALASWSWKYNIEGLNQHYRTYAIDAMGEVGKSVLYDVKKHTKNGQDIADLYSEISDKLGIDQAYVIGASYGGFIGTNYAIYAPARVKKLVLIASMGVTPATGSTLFRILLLSFFPVKPYQDYFVRWMIGEITNETREIVEWMRLVFDGVRAKEAPPVTFTSQQLESVQIPVLLILGNKDNLVGDHEKVREYTRNVPDIQIEVLNTGHGVWAEEPDMVNSLIYEFLEQR
jgi:pimeloyl-ACP methyl ester carboxylesterase